MFKQQLVEAGMLEFKSYFYAPLFHDMLLDSYEQLGFIAIFIVNH